MQTLDRLFAQGLNLTLDGAPIGGLDPARFVVTLEYPLSIDQFGEAAAAFATRVTPGLLRTGLIIDGAVSVNGTAISWALSRSLYFYLAQAFESLDGFADQQQYARARMLLEGRTIWGAAGAGGTPYLDGQCLGVGATRSDGKTPRTDLALPSGAAALASDFNSWFYLAPVPRIASFAANPPAVAWVPIPGALLSLRLVDATNQNVAVTPVLNLALNYTAIADTQVAISVSGGTPGIVSIESPVTIPGGSTAPQPIPITVGNPGAVTQTYTLTAAVVLASGTQFPMQTTFTVTGHARIVRSPILTGSASPFTPPAATSG